jgi:hypothetical protein
MKNVNKKQEKKPVTMQIFNDSRTITGFLILVPAVGLETTKNKPSDRINTIFLEFRGDFCVNYLPSQSLTITCISL